jgi:hypothetical protein
MFESKPADQTMQTCLRTRSPPHTVRIKPGTHLRHVTAQVLARTVRPFLKSAAKRSALVAWLQGVAKTGGSISNDYPLPTELMMHGQLNPTVTALVVAMGAQLDMVDAAVQDLQVTARQMQVVQLLAWRHVSRVTQRTCTDQL